jgi:signal transduction histidine kinase
MALKATSRASAAALAHERLVTGRVAREALERYPWPPASRMAGYVAVCAALVATLLGEVPLDAGLTLLSVVLAGLIGLGFHWLSECQAQMSVRKRALYFGTQLICATILAGLTSNDMGPCIFFFVLAAELQFLVPFRAAIAGTLLLWPLLVGAILAGNRNLYAQESPAVLAITALTGFVFVAAFTRSAVVEVIQRHQATLLLDELNQTHAQLKTYVDRVEELTVARERNRMAREIHDTLGHYLTVINVQIETAQKLGARDAGRAETALATAKRLASECLAEVRRSVSALRPAALDDVTLPEAIGSLIEEWRRESDVTIHVEGHGSGVAPPAVEVAVYRVIQEALTNVRKHAAARNVWLRTEWGPHYLVSSVRDDGRGADSDALRGDGQAGFGLCGMRERIEAVGGTLDVDTAPGKGFCVTVRVPFPEPASGA